MKNKLFFLVTFICLQNAFANSLQNVSLILPRAYSSNSGLLKTVTSSFLVDTVGEFTNIEEVIKKKLSPYEDVMEKYYSKEQREALIKNVSTHINDRILMGDMTDSRAINMANYIGQEFVGKIFERVLEVEGITDPLKRQAWSQKLLGPFKQCIQNSSNYLYDASGCIESLTSSLVPNVGLALTYEMSNEKLAGALAEQEREGFVNERTEAYQECFGSSNKDAQSVTNCALDSIKEGVVLISEGKVQTTINEATSDPVAQRRIFQRSTAPFKLCIGKVGSASNLPYDKQINNCLDTLISNVGQQMVPLKISQNESVVNALSSRELENLLPQKQAEFKACINQMIEQDQRVGGLIDSGLCERRLTNNITRTVLLKVFNTNVQSNLSSSEKSLSDEIFENAKNSLDGCWSEDIQGQEKNDCMKNAISGLSLDIANEKIQNEIGSESERAISIRSNLTSEFSQCLNSSLVGNLSEDPELNNKIGKCTGELTKNSAMKIAELQLSEIIGDKFSGTEKAHIINKHVYLDLDRCLGDLPTEEILAKCVDSLKKNASLDIAGLSFSEEIDKFIKTNGGKDRLGMKTSDVQKLKLKLKEDLTKCIEAISSTDPMSEINECIKGRIKELALTLGGYQFNSSAAPLYNGREDVLSGFYNTFNQNFSSCLSKNDGVENSLDSYMSNLSVCTNDISAQTMESMGQDQIRFALAQNLKDRPGISREDQREKIAIDLLTPFRDCLNKEAVKEKCINELKANATKRIVEQYAHNEVEFQLNTSVIPHTLQAILNEFKFCMANTDASNSRAQDNCVKTFSIKFAGALGELKVKAILTSTLGSSDYSLNEEKINDVLKDYNKCLRNLNVKEYVNEVTDGVTECISFLQKNAEDIVKTTAASWISTASPFEDFNTILASSLPCFATLVPASPYNENLQENVDSALKPVAIILGQYLDYNIAEAKNDLPVVLEKLLKDLNQGESEQARSNLVDTLVETGALDQLIKAIILDKVKTGLSEIPDSELPQAVKDKIASKENLNSIFAGETAQAIRDIVATNILRPVLVNGESMTGEKVAPAIEDVTKKVTEALATSDRFGKEIIQASVQNQINNMSSVKTFFGKLLYGKDSFRWSNVRNSSKGQIAENFIATSILLPRLRGDNLSAQELERINRQAEELVTDAVKNYD